MSYENIADECFAYPSMRRYPIHTKDDALKSCSDYNFDKRAYSSAVCAEIERNLDKAASFHGFSREIMEKEASGAENTMLEFSGRSGSIRMSEIRTTEDIEAAADFIISKRASTRLQDLENAAKYVTWCAANSDLDMNSQKLRKVARIAGIGVGDREKIQESFIKRAQVLHFGGSEREAFWKYAKEMESLSDEDFYTADNLRKIANAMEDMDERFGQERTDSTELEPPEDTVFEQSVDDLEQEAGDLITIPSIDTTISKEKLQEYAGKVSDFFRDYLGKDMSGDDAMDMDKIADTIKGFDSVTANKFLEDIQK